MYHSYTCFALDSRKKLLRLSRKSNEDNIEIATVTVMVYHAVRVCACVCGCLCAIEIRGERGRARKKMSPKDVDLFCVSWLCGVDAFDKT